MMMTVVGDVSEMADMAAGSFPEIRVVTKLCLPNSEARSSRKRGRPAGAQQPSPTGGDMADPLHLARPRVLPSQVLSALPAPHPGPVAACECPPLPRPEPECLCPPW